MDIYPAVLVEDDLTVTRLRGTKIKLLPTSTLRNHYKTSSEQFRPRPAHLPVFSSICGQIIPSRKAFDQLKPTSIDELPVSTRADDTYVLGRVIEDVFGDDISWNTLIEDQRGNVCYLITFYNFRQEVFKVGNVLVIKEPHISLAYSQLPFIRCDCPSDISLLTPSHPLFYLTTTAEWSCSLSSTDILTESPVPTTALEWKKRGKHFLSKNLLSSAIDAFYLGVKMCQQNDKIWKNLQRNLAETFLELGYYEKALDIVEEVLELYPGDKKCCLLGGKANYQLRNYRQAFQMLERIDNDDTDILKRCRQRIYEQETGDIDETKLKIESEKSPFVELDCAEYFGPIKVVDVDGKGRGVVATDYIQPGTLLMAAKAVMVAVDRVQDANVSLNYNNSRFNSKLVAAAIRQVAKNPRTFGTQIYDLSTGTLVKEKIQLYCDLEKKDEVICDVEALIGICNANCFSGTPVDGSKRRYVNEAVFLMPSFFNHSCVPNARHSLYNNVLLFYATEQIAPEEEVVTHYVSTSAPFQTRKELLTFWNIRCQCARCLNRE